MAFIGVFEREGIAMSKNHKSRDMTFAKRLDKLMQERKIYPSDVAKLTGLHRNRIYDYLSGNIQPSAYAVALIAKGLSVSADWLLGLTDKK